MAKGYDVSQLPQYVEVNKDLIIKDVVLAPTYGDTIGKMQHQLGIKTSEKLNYLNVAAVLQEANGCGFNPSGSTVITDRQLDTAQIAVMDEFCEETLLNKWVEYTVRVSAEEDPMPFESEIMDGVVKSINKQMEKLVWQGDTNNGDVLNGIVTIALGADSASTITGETASGASVMAAVRQAYMALPEELLNDDQTTVFLSPAMFRQYVMELVDANMYHYAPNNEEVNDIFIAGTSIKCHKTLGLEGSNYVVATSYKNLGYGCDLMDAKEIADLWFSKDNGTFRYRIRYNAGVMSYFPDEIVVIEKK